MTFAVTLGAETLTNYVRRIDIWQKPLPFGIGRWAITILNDGSFVDTFAADDLLTVNLEGLTFFKGYLDIVKPIRQEHEREMLLTGRDMAQDLMNKSVEGLYNEKADDIIEDLLDLTSSEITYTSPSTAPVIYHDSKGWSFLIDQFNSILQSIDFEGYVNNDKAFHMWDVGSQTGSIYLYCKEPPNDGNNNILKIIEHTEVDSLEQRNIIIVFGSDVDDHYTELNANGYTILYTGNAISDFADSTPTAPRKGIAAIKVTANQTGGVNNNSGAKITFPKYFHWYLDFSNLADDVISFQLYFVKSGGATCQFLLLLVDTDDNEIYRLYPGKITDVWHTITAPVGADTIADWTFLVGSTFNWKVKEVKFDFGNTNAASRPDYTLLDAWKMPIQTVAVVDESGADRDKHLPLTKTDVACQLELEAYAASIAAKRKSPYERLHLIARGDAGLLGSTPSWRWTPGYYIWIDIPEQGINSEKFRAIDLHHIITDPGNDTVPEHTVDLELIPYLTKLDSQRWSYGKDGKIALIRRLHDRLRWIESRKGYVA